MDGSCRWYIKNNICKHLIGISKIQNIPGCEIPLSVKNVPIGEKRKPGRPAKAKQALIVQPPKVEQTKIFIITERLYIHNVAVQLIRILIVRTNCSGQTQIGLSSWHIYFHIFHTLASFKNSLASIFSFCECSSSSIQLSPKFGLSMAAMLNTGMDRTKPSLSSSHFSSSLATSCTLDSLNRLKCVCSPLKAG
ncbi:hypothetical protein BpHYR1_040979 [Brachionus plicatilis]|uniref:SWIM-type domain-containing protein n=1 Tax=Brachionus plicatilis TaxID=10195 RepID=A0A3M7R7C6_BRAPC|nr:hypothetical protein BpHYR1_040979 [Brachionus plicatilis]